MFALYPQVSGPWYSRDSAPSAIVTERQFQFRVSISVSVPIPIPIPDFMSRIALPRVTYSRGVLLCRFESMQRHFYTLFLCHLWVANTQRRVALPWDVLQIPRRAAPPRRAKPCNGHIVPTTAFRLDAGLRGASSSLQDDSPESQQRIARSHGLPSTAACCLAMGRLIPTAAVCPAAGLCGVSSSLQDESPEYRQHVARRHSN